MSTNERVDEDIDDGSAPEPTEPIAPGQARDSREVVAARHEPEVIARYRDEVQGLLHSLFDEFLHVQEPLLHNVLQSARALDAHEGTLLVKALQSVGIRFQLTAIAEEIADTRQVRLTETADGAEAVIGSFHRTLGRAAARGVSDAEVSEALSGLMVSPTIAAHPTEAKRVTILETHRRIYRGLVELETGQWTPRERERLIGELRNAIALLWMTGELRLEHPSTDEEVSWGLHFFGESLTEGTKEAGHALADALRRHFPNVTLEAPAFLKFGSWIGGDRDGDPDVTTSVTRRTLHRHRENAIRRYVAELDRLARILSISAHVNPPGDAFERRLKGALEATGDAEAVARRNPHEPFRQFCVASAVRLRASLGDADTDAVPYAGPDEFVDDLRALEGALREIGAGGIATSDVGSLRYLVTCFGFRTVSLDIRQNAGVIGRTVRELGGTPGKLGADLADGVKIDTESLDPKGEAAETVALFRLLGEHQPDPDAIGAFVLSNVSSVDDLLGVAWLASALGVTENLPPIVPLFQTIEDLRAAPRILDEVLSDTYARAVVTDGAGVVEIMLGYFDAKRDGGCLAAVRELSEAQRAVLSICKQHEIPVRFFHGGGGPISRGGAQTGRAIAAQPPGAVRTQLRVTEQGEVASAKYANRETARTHLELLGASVLNSTLASASGEEASTEGRSGEVMAALSDDSRAAYRELIEMPEFRDYFVAASPVEELSLLRTGSRPRTSGLDDMRAISWVFAWSQNRHLVTGWYGLGSALDARLQAGELDELKSLFAELKVFRLVIDDVEKSLYQTDLGIAARYSRLVKDEHTRQHVFDKISAEHDLTVRHVLSITGEESIAERFPRFRRRIDGARPLIDRCNAWQIGLLGRHRADPSEEWSRVPLLLSMHCIATGLGWSG